MATVALIRPVWWIACRSVRFVTALVLMGLLLGGGGARAGLSESQPVVTGVGQSTVEAVDAGAPVGGPSVGVGQPAVADEPSGVADELAPGPGDESGGPGAAASAWPIRAASLGVQPEQPGLPAETGAGPTGDAYPGVVGPRAPPLG